MQVVEFCFQRQMPRTYEEASTFMQDRFEEMVIRNRSLQTLAAKGKYDALVFKKKKKKKIV